jgi:phage N-6-adenine-methyltransferase
MIGLAEDQMFLVCAGCRARGPSRPNAASASVSDHPARLDALAAGWVEEAPGVLGTPTWCPACPPPKRSGAGFHVGESRQDYPTPQEFVDAVEKRFGKIGWDLAASAENARCEHYLDEDMDSLSVDWAELPLADGEICWLNPPYSRIAPWAGKCAESGVPVALLVPASVGSDWFADYVYSRALVLPLRPRLSFDSKQPYPKDLMLCVYSASQTGFEPWRWK